MSPRARQFLQGGAAVVVAALTTVQSRINGQLGHDLGSGLVAAWISFLVGLIAVSLLVVATQSNRRALVTLRAAVRSGGSDQMRLKRWHLLGGLGGATFVAAQSTTVQYLGVAIFTVAVVAAQNASSLAVDQVGLGPHGVQPVTVGRILAALCATVGVAVAVLGESSTGVSFVLSALMFALVAGALVAVQQAINGRVSVASGSAWVAGLMNFIVGFAGLSLVVAIVALTGNLNVNPVPGPLTEPLLYIGGLIGVAFIVVAAAVVRTLGVLLFALLSIAGQMVGALLLDVIAPEAGRPITWQLMAGVVITGAAVALAAMLRSR